MRLPSRLCCLLSVLLFGLAALRAIAAFDPASLQQQLTERFGQGRVVLLKNWLNAVQSVKAKSDEDRLRQINDFINQHIAFEDDISVWQQSDYWATPLETIGQGRGDCEDFSILKYFSLREAGIPTSKLRLVYVKATLQTRSGPVQQAHMVLAYYPSPNVEPLILDNLESSIRPATQRDDLQPVFSFNSEGIFAGAAGKDKATSGGLGRLSRWEDALRRIRAEGFE